MIGYDLACHPMNFRIHKTLPSPDLVRSQIPATRDILQKVSQDRKEIKAILSGKDSRKLLIVGPCSAWPIESVIEYAKKLAPLAQKYRPKLKIVLRSYLQKSRSAGGWMGVAHQPNVSGDTDVEQGIGMGRKIFLEILSLGLPVSDELVFLSLYPYFEDLLSWAALGARSSEDPMHRLFVSGLEIPVGIKNPTSGYTVSVVNAVQVAQTSQEFVFGGQQIATSGNPYAHVLLRGGGGKSNYDSQSLQTVLELLNKKCVQNKSILIDASHENCRTEKGEKDPFLQIKVVRDVLHSCQKNSEFFHLVKGFLLESFLHTGEQDIASKNIIPGLSITDPCLGWKETHALIQEIAETLPLR